MSHIKFHFRQAITRVSVWFTGCRRNAQLQRLICSTWKWASNYIRFSKAAPFLSGLLFSKAFIEIAFKAFLISYIVDAGNTSLRGAIALSAAFEGIGFFLTVAVHHIAIDRLGLFRTIIVTIPCLFLGLLMLWLSSSFVSGKANIVIFYTALPLLTAGFAGEDASLEVLFEEDNIVVDQTKSRRQQRQDYEDVVAGRASLWSYGASTVGKFVYGPWYCHSSWWPRLTHFSSAADAITNERHRRDEGLYLG
ncbi:hypothetical protein V6N12_051665 [Hibiscus sabdariffa]|uniref:Uncharacterized protein n=1 Tax=Hibiscus sabdariffa TaxID=183260 RepID=A0ABR2GGS7_9ROSI